MGRSYFRCFLTHILAHTCIQMHTHTHTKIIIIENGVGVKLWEKMDAFMVLMMVMISQMYACPQTNQDVYIK